MLLFMLLSNTNELNVLAMLLYLNEQTMTCVHNVMLSLCIILFYIYFCISINFLVDCGDVNVSFNLHEVLKMLLVSVWGKSHAIYQEHFLMFFT